MLAKKRKHTKIIACVVKKMPHNLQLLSIYTNTTPFCIGLVNGPVVLKIIILPVANMMQVSPRNYCKPGTVV